MNRKIIWPSGDDAEVTPEQRDAISRIATRFNLPEVVTVHPYGSGVVLTNVGSMWIGVEVDGYAHS